MNKFSKSTNRVLTRRGVLWLGQTCNFKCQFCYFLDRIKTKDHPEHPFMSLAKAKQICDTLVNYYHNNAIDIQGGEPTIYPQIHELITHCRQTGLLPTLITNGLVLANQKSCKKLKDAGIRDLLISVHGLGDDFDTLVGVRGAHKKQMQALENLITVGIPFRFNCVLSKVSLKKLSAIAQLAIDKGAGVVNFIAFNPFEDQQKQGRRSALNVPLYKEVAPFLMEAMEILHKAEVECNVRYFPLCMVKEKYRKSLYNFQQLSYDIHEWDYASWSWTGMQSQRMRDGEISRTISLKEATVEPPTYPGPLQFMAIKAREKLAGYPTLLNAAVSINRTIGKTMANTGKQNTTDMAEESLYRENARIRAQRHCCYVYAERCDQCSVKSICDGFHGDYASLFGSEEASPIILPETINDPKYYISHQLKVVEEEDYGWAK